MQNKSSRHSVLSVRENYDGVRLSRGKKLGGILYNARAFACDKETDRRMDRQLVIVASTFHSTYYRRFRKLSSQLVAMTGVKET